MLVEDSLSVRYLNLLTSEVESVLESKRDLRRYASMMRDMLLQDGGEQAENGLRRWKTVLDGEGLHLAFYDRQEHPVLSDGLTDMVLEDGRQDFKGQSMRSMLDMHRSTSEGQFAVVRVPDGSGEEIPVLVCFMPVRDRGTLVLADPVADAEESRAMMEKRMVLGIQERLDGMELSRGASISVVAADGRVLAGKGVHDFFTSIPEDVLQRVRSVGDRYVRGPHRGAVRISEYEPVCCVVAGAYFAGGKPLGFYRLRDCCADKRKC